MGVCGSGSRSEIHHRDTEDTEVHKGSRSEKAAEKVGLLLPVVRKGNGWRTFRRSQTGMGRAGLQACVKPEWVGAGLQASVKLEWVEQAFRPAESWSIKARALAPEEPMTIPHRG